MPESPTRQSRPAVKPGDVYRDTARNHEGGHSTFTLREPGVSGPAVNFDGMPGWHGTRSDYGEWFVTDYALSNFYERVEEGS